jgi:hypothetical protein
MNLNISKEFKEFRNQKKTVSYEKLRSKLNPIYFINVVWGKEYLEYFFNYHIASLLSQGNLPSLKNRNKNKYLIACPEKEEQIIKNNSIYKKLIKYLKVEFYRIPICPAGLSGCIHMGIGHKILTEEAYNNKALAVLLTPDLLLSDNTLKFVEYLATKKYEVVLTTALRFGTEPLFKNLKKNKILSNHKINRTIPLEIPPRDLVKNCLKSLHSQTASYEFESDAYSEFPVATWWWANNKKGMLIYSFSWAPLLVDYSAVSSHDTSMMDDWTIDGDYIHKNFPNHKIYVSRDSDEIMLASWGSLEVGKVSLKKRRIFKFRFFKNYLKSIILANTFENKSIDPLKRKIFIDPAYWHVEDLNSNWDELEQMTKKIILSSVNPNLLNEIKTRGYFYKTGRIVAKNSLRLMRILIYYFQKSPLIFQFLYQLIFNFPVATARLKRHIKLVFIHIIR